MTRTDAIDAALTVTALAAMPLLMLLSLVLAVVVVVPVALAVGTVGRVVRFAKRCERRPPIAVWPGAACRLDMVRPAGIFLF